MHLVPIRHITEDTPFNVSYSNNAMYTSDTGTHENEKAVLTVLLSNVTFNTCRLHHIYTINTDNITINFKKIKNLFHLVSLESPQSTRDLVGDFPANNTENTEYFISKIHIISKVDILSVAV